MFLMWPAGHPNARTDDELKEESEKWTGVNKKKERKEQIGTHTEEERKKKIIPGAELPSAAPLLHFEGNRALIHALHTLVYKD